MSQDLLSGETFPLPWERVLWTATPAFPLSLARPRTRYVCTDFRAVVRSRHRTVQELALNDIDHVTLTQTWWQRLVGTSTVSVWSGRHGRALAIANIRHGPQLAFVLQLRATELRGDGSGDSDIEFFRASLEPEAPSILRPHQGLLLAATTVFALLFVGVGLARHEAPPVIYSDDDPIAPGGERRSTEAIVAFMEREVMPFARRALAPLVGGADEVACETCHGQDALARNWRMPGVRALPEPELRLAGLERARAWLDPQIRNAVYGYLAEEDKQATAAYMRREVMPGMAKIMKRPPYDFAKSYGYNRSQAAVGCYHCHLVE